MSLHEVLISNVSLIENNFLVWLLHCHIDFHAEVGMALMLKVGEYSQMAPVPRSFPTCNDYVAESSEVIKSKASSRSFGASFLLLTLAAMILLK